MHENLNPREEEPEEESDTNNCENNGQEFLQVEFHS